MYCLPQRQTKLLHQYLKYAVVHVDGGMREYLVVPTYSLLHGDGLSFDELALVEPLAIGAHGVRRSGVQSGENVLVIGCRTNWFGHYGVCPHCRWTGNCHGH